MYLVTTDREFSDVTASKVDEFDGVTVKRMCHVTAAYVNKNMFCSLTVCLTSAYASYVF